MPKQVTKTGTPRSSDGATYVVGVTRPTASYIYLADGTKVQAIGETGQGYEYLGSLRLSVNGSNVDIESIPFAGGRIVKTSNGYEPQYYITDHLGSTRTVVKPNATVVAEFDYMPYGTLHSVATAPTTEADYKYTGKEQQTAFGLDNLYDSQARFQYVSDGSFMSHDDLAEQFQWLSPYNYCAGNPINKVDQDGKSAIGITLIMSSISLWEIIATTAAATAATTTAYVAYNNYKNRDYGQGWRYQGDQDRKRKEALDRAQANVQKAINNSCPDPNNYDPNNQGGPRKDPSLSETVVLGLLLSSQLISTEHVVPTISFWYHLLTDGDKYDNNKRQIKVPDEPMIYRQSETMEQEDTDRTKLTNDEVDINNNYMINGYYTFLNYSIW